HQHYINFKERLKDFPLKVEMLSRFVSSRKKQQILKELQEGKIDIIIGTHLLLQDKVKFKDLGLLIIDEEHRFGVRQKEKIKQMRYLIDILSLSATPIPRTLYLALSGIRELSLILTPPPERLEVLTEVREFNLHLIKEAIQREIDRNGQVFFVHNHIEDLDSFQSIIKKLVPRAKTSIIHGQMKSERIEKEMIKFINGEINVLITTTIIASGLDIPNANTIIINEAHKFGLAELYQLRGRVGRYKVKAYAYFLVPPKEVLSHEARRRLYAIQSFAHLGSGYHLALEDLQIRGAGNILGEEQHGHIQAVGLALYTELLSRTIAELKGETYLPYIPTKIEVGISVSLPSAFLNEKEKLFYYKRLSQAKEKEEIENIQRELEDRLGRLPEETINLFEIQKIKLLAFRKGIEYIRKRKEAFLIRFLPEISLYKKAEILHTQKPGRIFVTPQGELGYTIKEEKNTLTLLKELLSLLPEDS
ncbi:DEAD/DEAH box helicase, partial [Candidatus Calescamantes bacterium]|nr:DEAD/DEAH box helicase [Candidatus Calescamantes bacterium]